MLRPDSSHPGANPRATEAASELFLPSALEEKPIWAALYGSVRDAFFPPHLPPLHLTSKPIPVSDRMSAKTNPWAVGSSTALNGGILAVILLLGMRAALNPGPRPSPGAPIDLSHLRIFAPFQPKASNGGNGGGTHDLVDPMQGRPPQFSSAPMTPPMAPIIVQPKLPVDSAIDIKLLQDSSMPNLGVPSSTQVTLDSNGTGGPHGIGTGRNGNYGPGDGPGWGPGSGNSIYIPGRDGVIAPKVIFAPDAEFSDEARRNKYQGICLVSIIVDAHGIPQNLRVTRPLGMGLDEKALEAIRRYRFKPAMKDGKPVAAMMIIQVDFHLF